jgi:capsular exopolysaccharide synthesis family protein
VLVVAGLTIVPATVSGAAGSRGSWRPFPRVRPTQLDLFTAVVGGGAVGRLGGGPDRRRAHLRYFNVDRDVRTLLVVSAIPGDGKTTIAHHLAAAAARVGARVLLLEADLRRPVLAQQLGAQPGPGLADVLIGAVPWSEATQAIDVDEPSGEGAKVRTLDVLVAGAGLPPNPGELVETDRRSASAMETLLERAKSEYDLVVIDTPPLTAVSDAFPLLGKVDGVVIVGVWAVTVAMSRNVCTRRSVVRVPRCWG